MIVTTLVFIFLCGILVLGVVLGGAIAGIVLLIRYFVNKGRGYRGKRNLIIGCILLGCSLTVGVPLVVSGILIDASKDASKRQHSTSIEQRDDYFYVPNQNKYFYSYEVSPNYNTEETFTYILEDGMGCTCLVGSVSPNGYEYFSYNLHHYVSGGTKEELDAYFSNLSWYEYTQDGEEELPFHVRSWIQEYRSYPSIDTLPKNCQDIAYYALETKDYCFVSDTLNICTDGRKFYAAYTSLEYREYVYFEITGSFADYLKEKYDDSTNTV